MGATKGDSGPRAIGNLKIVVVGTPKTGNTWVKYLLAGIYDLPVIGFPLSFSLREVESAGSRWVAHQHLLPSQDLLDWGLENNVAFVTPIRHPGDVLVSLWHHVRQQTLETETDDSTQAASMRFDDARLIGKCTRRFVEDAYYLYLNLSVAWLGRGLASVVRYEGLWDRPLETLRSLTDDIVPVPDERIRMAASSCELSLMQLLLDPEKKLFRQGGVGGWVEALPAHVKGLLAELDPYPQQFAALGYTMDESDPANAVRQAAARVPGPFGSEKSFQNGVPITPILVKVYFELPAGVRARWRSPGSISDDSFFNWLNRPAAVDAKGRGTVPMITELAYFIYSVRPDVRSVFPDIFSKDRVGFTEWFLFHARGEYGLHSVFFKANPFPDENRFADGTPVSRILVRVWLDLPEALRKRWPNPVLTDGNSFLAWLTSPAASDPFSGKQAPVVTELGAYLHSIRPDLRSTMPDLYGQHRVLFSNWFLTSARKEYSLDRTIILPVIRSWAALAEVVQAMPAGDVMRRGETFVASQSGLAFLNSER